MDSVAVNTSFLKRDALGRVTLKREQREALLDEFERSGIKGQPLWLGSTISVSVKLSPFFVLPIWKRNPLN